MPDEEFITKAECYKTHTQITTDFATIKKALVGDDLRGGIVKDVADIKAALNNPPKSSGGCDHLSRRERAMIYCAVIAAFASVAVALISALVH